MSNPEHFVGPWHVEYPENLKKDVEKASEAWVAFTKLESSVQDAFTAENHFDGFGFERKIGDGSEKSAHSNDIKLNFDFTKRGIATLDQVAASIPGGDGEIVRNFIKSGSSLIDSAQSAIAEVGGLIEEQSGHVGFKALAEASGPNAFFRFLYYPAGVDVNSVVGEPHPDNSGFTLHLGESTNGCEWLDADGATWHDMPVYEGQATAFASMQTQLTTNGEVDALWHRIIANETTHEFGRVAVVCFVALNDTPKYDRARHGRLQDFHPGETYGETPKLFRNRFTS